MSILDTLPHTCTALIRQRIRGAMGGSRDVFTQVFTNRECWRQFKSAAPIVQYQKRGFAVVDAFYFTTDPAIDERHVLLVDGLTWDVLSRAEPDATVGLGIVYKVMAGLWTTNTTINPADIIVPEPTPTPTTEAEEDILDFADIGGTYDNQALALANRNALISYLAQRATSNKDVCLRFSGPINTSLNDKREPGTAYIDLASGPISITVGGSANVANLLFFGFGTIVGVNAASAITPIFLITRTAGTTPDITLRDLRFSNNDGSGLSLLQPGATTRLENIHIEYGGSGTLSQDDWDDLDTAGYGLKVDEADGLWVSGFGCSSGGGNGVIAKRWHAGRFEGNIRVQNGAGFKGQQISVGDVKLRAESNVGFGLMLRNCGSDRYASGSNLIGSSTNKWQVWLEANNGRSTPYTTSGYAFSQMMLENVARMEIQGHTGWRNNQARLDGISRQRNKLIEEQYTSVSADPVLELVTSGTVDGDITLPADGLGNASVTNWGTVWTDVSYRPTATLVGTAGVDQRVRITWPAGSYNNTVGTSTTAYWRPWGGNALTRQSSPAAFYFEAEVEDVDGNIATYCAARESANNRQTAIVGGFVIEPISGGLLTFPLWDTLSRKFSGQTTVDDTRSDISPGFNAWIPGMQDREDGTGNSVPQTAQHVMDIHQLRLWRFA